MDVIFFHAWTSFLPSLDVIFVHEIEIFVRARTLFSSTRTFISSARGSYSLLHGRSFRPRAEVILFHADVRFVRARALFSSVRTIVSSMRGQNYRPHGRSFRPRALQCAPPSATSLLTQAVWFPSFGSEKAPLRIRDVSMSSCPLETVNSSITASMVCFIERFRLSTVRGASLEPA
jgi:hypothetical protein